MPCYVVTGKLGTGKSLFGLYTIKQYLLQNRVVATNMDIKLDKLIGIKSKQAEVYRIPDQLTPRSMKELPWGCQIRDESMYGALVLDECALSMNTRDFQAKDRKKLIEWFVHARKKRWDVYLIVQNVTMLDKQIRDLLAEHVVHMMRFDRFKIPLIHGLVWACTLGFYSPRLPKFFKANVVAGTGNTATLVDTHMFSGKDLFPAYDTEQMYDGELDPDLDPDNEGAGIAQLLPPYLTHGRYTDDWTELKRRFNDWKKGLEFKARNFFITGLLAGLLVTSYASNDKPTSKEEKQVVKQDSKTRKQTKSERPAAQPEVKKDLGFYLQPDYSHLEGLHIVGSFKYENGSFEYYFENIHGQSIKPQNYGLSVFWSSKCSAVLLKDGEKHMIRCAGVDVRESVTAATAQRNHANPIPQNLSENIIDSNIDYFKENATNLVISNSAGDTEHLTKQ